MDRIRVLIIGKGTDIMSMKRSVENSNDVEEDSVGKGIIHMRNDKPIHTDEDEDDNEAFF